MNKYLGKDYIRKYPLHMQEFIAQMDQGMQEVFKYCDSVEDVMELYEQIEEDYHDN